MEFFFNFSVTTFFGGGGGGGVVVKENKTILLSTAAQMDVSTDYKIQCLQVIEGVLVANLCAICRSSILRYFPHLYLLRLFAKYFNSNP